MNMKVQSLSICVPGGCSNNCHFCVSKMHREEYKNVIKSGNSNEGILAVDNYKRRLSFAKDSGCHCVILTGAGEPLSNPEFLSSFSKWNNSLNSPFNWIELQTSGVGLDDLTLRWLSNIIKVTTISLSLSSFDSDKNAEYNRSPKNKKVNIENICQMIKSENLNLRLSLNMTNDFDKYKPEEIFKISSEMGADQVTVRKLFASKENSKQSHWVKNNSCSDEKIEEIQKYIIENGRELETLPFGAKKYSVNGIGTIVDDDCMSTKSKDVVKQLILRPDAHLYSRWDDKGSLIY